ncbi:MAG: hypothetical protein R3C09_02730 [Pirellulaceae bacterium]
MIVVVPVKYQVRFRLLERVVGAELLPTAERRATLRSYLAGLRVARSVDEELLRSRVLLELSWPFERRYLQAGTLRLAQLVSNERGF